MKNIYLVSALTLSTLFLNSISLKASETLNEAQREIETKRLILNYLPAHSFVNKEDLEEKHYESGPVTFKNSIDLSHEDLTDDNMKDFIEKLMTDPYREELQVLALQKSNISTLGAISLASALDYLKNLQELDITQNSIGIFGLQAIFMKASTLHAISSLKFSAEEKDIPEIQKVTKAAITSIGGKAYKATFNKENQ